MPYITHLVFNAGVASFKSIEYWALFKQLFTSPLASITAPVYYTQHKGEVSPDNLGWVWQSNVFGHFVLVCHCIEFFTGGYSKNHFASSVNLNHYFPNHLSMHQGLSGRPPSRLLQNSMIQKIGNSSKRNTRTKVLNIRLT